MTKSKSFFDEIRWFAVIFLILGLWPTWKDSKQQVTLALYSLFAVIIPCYIFVSAIIIHKVVLDENLTKAVAYSFILSILATHLIIVVQAFFYRNGLTRLTDKFSNVDRLFNTKLQLFISYRKENQVLFLRMFIFMALLIGIKVFLVIHLNWRGHLSGFWLHCLYSVLITRMRCAQVLFFVQMLRSRLALVNEKLKEIIIGRGLRDNSANEWRPVIDTKNIVFVLDNSFSKHSVYDRLLFLKQIYGELYEICELINITFGWSLLALITQCFIDFTSNR